jgi:hypothetical protein
MSHEYAQLGAENQSLPCAWLMAVCCLAISFTITGCTVIDQEQYDTEHTAISLGPRDLENYGIGFLTPSAATGREADKQALAMNFSMKLQEMRPDVRVLSLPRVLSAVNTADLDEQYKQIYRDYLETGILEGSILRRVSGVTDVRYFAQLSLASFTQQSKGRFSLLGLRVSQTTSGNLRVFLQIWDARQGTVAWEGSTELNYAYETGAEKPVTFQVTTQMAARQLFLELPGAIED